MRLLKLKYFGSTVYETHIELGLMAHMKKQIKKEVIKRIQKSLWLFLNNFLTTYPFILKLCDFS